MADDTTLNRAVAKTADESNSPESLYVLGLAYLNRYDNGLARETFEKMLAIDGSNVGARWGLAECLRREHQYLKCQPVFEEIIESTPEFSPAYLSLAYVKYIQADFNASARLAYKVIKQGRDEVDISNFVRALCLFAGNKGMIAHYGGLLSKAINGRLVLPYLNKAYSLQPDSATVQFGLGSYYLLVPPVFGRDIDKAEVHLKKAITVSPLLADAYVRLAQVYKLRGDTAKYEAYIKKALGIDPGNEMAVDIYDGRCKFICLE